MNRPMASPHAPTRALLNHRARVEEILSVFSRYGIAQIADAAVHRGLADFLPARLQEESQPMTDGERLREALAQLGPTFIKIGQILSTRIDLVGPDVAADLKSLQTATPADSEDAVRETVEGDLGKPVEEAFASFDSTPLASASVAQAHPAALHDGTEVIVKVQHAGIQGTVAADFDILEALAAVVEERDASMALYRPRGVIMQLRRTVLAELDLVREARTLARARANFDDDVDVVIPRPYPELSGPRVLTMSRLEGESLAVVAQDDSIDRRAFALRAARIFLDMIFRDGLFHADPHPGNIMVVVTPEGLRYGIIDWGEVGRIDEALEDKLSAFVLATAMGDRDDVADSMLEIVTAPPHLDLDGFRLDLSDWLDTHGSSGMENLDVAAAVSDVTRIVRSHRLRMPPDVAMLGKTLIQLQGNLSLAGAELRIPEAFEGYTEQLVKKRVAPERMLRRARRTAHDWDRLLEQAPRDIGAILDAVRMGDLEVPLRLDTLDHSVNRLVNGILAAALITGATNLWARGTPPLTKRGMSIPGAAGTIASAVFALRALRAARRGDVAT